MVAYPLLLGYISLCTVQQPLHDMLFRCLRARRTPLLGASQTAGRVILPLPLSFGLLITFLVTGTSGGTVDGKPKSNLHLPQYTIKTVKHSQMVWKLFTYNSVVAL